MDDLLQEFIAEASESLSVIDQELVRLEQCPNDAGILGNIFRLVHTVKGTCGFLGLPRLEKVAHSGENVLGKFRDGELDVNSEAVTVILECIDCIRDILATLEQTGEEPEGDDSGLIGRLNGLLNDDPNASKAAAPPASNKKVATPSEMPTNEFGAPVAPELLAELGLMPEASTEAESDANTGSQNEDDDSEDGQASNETSSNETSLANSSRNVAVVPPSEGEKASAGADLTKQDGGNQKRDSAGAASSLRINVDVLEDLMTLVSELVLARNQLMQMVRGADNHEFAAPLESLSHITSDLQERVMQTRMQPIGNAWSKLPRIIRDLSVASGKKIDLVMVGAETELDRQILDLIKDPLTHMIRNSADHGLESPEERLAAGKLESGTIKLNAFHEGGHIIIEIADDGRGLNTDRIRQKIVEKEIMAEAAATALSDQQVHQYIFHPGFSTAEKITNVSGRGVGMDVVRTNIEQINGSIDLRSVKGQGTTITIKIPLTLAIISALLVKCGSERFAIPQFSVVELVRATPDSEHKIEYIHQVPVLHLRKRLLPLIRLDRLLGLEGSEAIVNEKFVEDKFVVVTKTGNSSFGIVVDKVFDTEEIVVKPSSPILRGIKQFSGNTILGDGSVIMILDPNGIAAEIGDIQSQLEARDQGKSNALVDDKKVPLLLFRVGKGEPMAVPLALVARLEDFTNDEIERAGGYDMVQYRDKLMPLISLQQDGMLPDREKYSVLVFADRGRQFGLVVDEVIDIVEDSINIQMPGKRNGTLGSAVINGRATDVLDSHFYINQATGNWLDANGNSDTSHDGEKPKTLLVDDSAFFRSLISPLLSVEGWEVTAVSSAKDALALRDSGATFELIISDIDMPEIDGFDFAANIRSDDRWSNTPLIALSARTSEKNIDRAHQLGFTDYVAKRDREGLIRSIRSIIGKAAA